MDTVTTLAVDSPEEAIREIAGKLWRVPVGRLREGMREAKVNGCTKVLIIFTPAGLVTATFLPLAKKLGILIRAVGIPSWFALELPLADLMLEENQEREVGAIAHMTCDWQG